MPVTLGQVVLASTQSAIGWVIFAVLTIGFFTYLFINLRRAKPEVGSELELAANRMPYLPDEELEGRKLDRTLGCSSSSAWRSRCTGSTSRPGSRARPRASTRSS